jgi:hypothetical protein
MKDFYERVILSCMFTFDGGQLVRVCATRATFRRRATCVLAGLPMALAAEFTGGPHNGDAPERVGSKKATAAQSRQMWTRM